MICRHPRLSRIRQFVTCLLIACMPPLMGVPLHAATSPESRSLVQVEATCQFYEQFRPWLKRPPITRQAVAPVLPGGYVLVTAEMVANATFVELEHADNTAKTPAEVVVVDYEANLALLKGNNKDFFKDLRPLTLTQDTRVGDSVEVWQLEGNGALASTEGNINTIDVGLYPEGVARFLQYSLSISLQYRNKSVMLPVVRRGKLTGLLMRYDSRSQNGTILPAPVIEHFIKDAIDGPYQGFPKVGMGFATMRDPQLRTYTNSPDNGAGIYVTRLVQGGPADKAGVQQGDVLVAINNLTIDQDGNYIDRDYGSLSVEHLINGESYVGDKLKVKILRQGKEKELSLTLDRKDPKDYVIPPYTYDQAPRYVVLGGITFLELTRPLLKEFGGNWVNNAPQKLVYMDIFQDELYPEAGRHFVVLGQVLPCSNTIGYERLGSHVITKINNMEIKTLQDVAKAALQPVEGFHKIEFNEDPKVIYLDALKASEEEAKIQKIYGIQSLQKLD